MCFDASFKMCQDPSHNTFTGIVFNWFTAVSLSEHYRSLQDEMHITLHEYADGKTICIRSIFILQMEFLPTYLWTSMDSISKFKIHKQCDSISNFHLSLWVLLPQDGNWCNTAQVFTVAFSYCHNSILQQLAR